MDPKEKVHHVRRQALVKVKNLDDKPNQVIRVRLVRKVQVKKVQVKKVGRKSQKITRLIYSYVNKIFEKIISIFVVCYTGINVQLLNFKFG